MTGESQTSEVVRMASSSKQSTASVGAEDTAWKRLEISEAGGGIILRGVEAGNPPSRAQSFKGGGLRLPSQSTTMELTLELPATALISLKMGEEEVMVRLVEVVMMAVNEEMGAVKDRWERVELFAKKDGRRGLGGISRALPECSFQLWRGWAWSGSTRPDNDDEDI